MYHYYFDGLRGFRSRLDSLELVHEVLQEICEELGIRPAMPPFLLPYYDGVLPQDCGISSFLFLAGGHATLHTFSFREAFFFDLAYPQAFDTALLTRLLTTAFPCQLTQHGMSGRGREAGPARPPSVEWDFGPHLLVDVEEYAGPCTLDSLFTLFDELPATIGMTPIMRPYVARSQTADGQAVLSAMTMIAESHISLHVFPDRKTAFFDLFSCRFFEPEPVLARILRALPGRVVQHALRGRGERYRLERTEHVTEHARTRAWLTAVPGSGA